MGILNLTIWVGYSSYVMLYLVLSALFDFNELKRLCPDIIRNSVSSLKRHYQRFDSMVLLGKRYRGREWNLEEFEFEDATLAISNQKSLLSLPPPSVREGRRLCVDKEFMKRDEWSNQTTKHVVAIDFCYVMLREEMIRKQASKIEKAARKEGISEDDVVSNAHTRSRSNSLSMIRDPPAIIATRSSSEDNPLMPDGNRMVHSPTEEIEVVQELPDTLFDEPPKRRSRVPPFSLERHDFSSIDDILEVEEDCSEPRTTSDSQKCDGSIGSSSSHARDMNWMDVGAEIGMKLLGSAHVQRAMTSQDTAERIIKVKEKMENSMNANSSVFGEKNAVEVERRSEPSSHQQSKRLSVPVHSMWTLASAAGDECLITTPTMASERDKSSIHDDIQEALKDSSLFDDGDDAQIPHGIGGSTHPENLNMKERQLHSEAASVFRSKMTTTLTSTDNPDRITPFNNESAAMGESFRSPPGMGSEAGLSACRNMNKRAPRRSMLLPGVKIVVPVCPLQPGKSNHRKKVMYSQLQMATVVSSKRIHVFGRNQMPPVGQRGTNCLSVTVKLDKSFLRNGEFTELTFRVMDEWGDRYMPKHSKLPIGSCVATAFGLGVLVGWRVEDDCHIVRSLWQKRGPGSAFAFLNRDSIHSTVEAAVGFDVKTSLGKGRVLAYVNGGKEFRSGRYFVKVREEGRHKGHVLELNRSDITECSSAQFIPITEHIREAAQYQLLVDTYHAELRKIGMDDDEATERDVARYADILWSSLMEAIDEDSNFDDGLNNFITSIVGFLERLDNPDIVHEEKIPDDSIIITATDSTVSSGVPGEKQDTGFWFMNDIFGFFGTEEDAKHEDPDESIEVERLFQEYKEPTSYDTAFSVIRTLLRTVTIAKTSANDDPSFKLGMNIVREVLLFIKMVVKVQQKNISPHSLEIWARAWEEIASTFGPLKERVEKIAKGIAERMERQGRRAKVRLLRFVDSVVQDDQLLQAIELGDWATCAQQVERSLMKAKIIDQNNRDYYHKTAQFVYQHFVSMSGGGTGAATRNNEKLAAIAKTVQLAATPRRSVLRLFMNDTTLDVFERLLVRVFQKEEKSSRMLNIHASNFQTLRHLRLLRDMTVSSAIWKPVLDAADAEFSWAVSRMPDNTKEFMVPLSNLFSLGVAQFRKISEGDLTRDFLDFLMEDEAVSIIQDIDMKLILSLEAFSRDVKEMMVVLPYYPSIEDDILNLMDEVDLEQFLKEASRAIDDPDALTAFLKEKSTVAIERFLDYLPKMSIPVEKRDLGDGWVLTCRGEDGADLTLSDVNIKRENLTCQVMGGDTIFFPMLGSEDAEAEEDTKSMTSSAAPPAPPARDHSVEESSILDHIRDLLLQAQKYGCWESGVGGVGDPPSDRYVASVLHELPVSSVLNCAIELWRNLEIDDDELLEIAVKDVSYQIQLQAEREAGKPPSRPVHGISVGSPLGRNSAQNGSGSWDSPRRRYNPRVDPTVIFLEMIQLSLNLDHFVFRIEKADHLRTIFDPVFEGSGSLLVKNVSIKLRIECIKERIRKIDTDVPVPVLKIRELDVQLERVKLKVRNTGADWVLNKVVKSFSDSMTQIMATNLKDQIQEQIELALENINSYFEVNPDMMLGLLGITMDDLEERVVWV